MESVDELALGTGSDIVLKLREPCLEIAATVGMLFNREIELTVVYLPSLIEGASIGLCSLVKVLTSSLGDCSLVVACEPTTLDSSKSLGGKAEVPATIEVDVMYSPLEFIVTATSQVLIVTV